MRRTSALLALFPLALALGACGDDGGGDTAAFCEIVEDLEGQDEPTLEEIEEAADAAPSEIEDEMELLVEAFRAFEEFEEEGDEAVFDEFDEEEFEAAGEEVEDFAREECGVDLDEDTDDAGGSDDESTTSTTEDDADETTTTTEAEDDDAGDTGSGLEEGEPDDPPSLDDPELDALAQECFEGSGQACDDLFFQTDAGSPEEEYGNTCGGRFDESPGFCAEAIGE